MGRVPCEILRGDPLDVTADLARLRHQHGQHCPVENSAGNDENAGPCGKCRLFVVGVGQPGVSAAHAARFLLAASSTVRSPSGPGGRCVVLVAHGHEVVPVLRDR